MTELCDTEEGLRSTPPGSLFTFLREEYRGAVYEEDGWPVNGHDAAIRLGARFEDILPRLIDVAEESDRFGSLHPGLSSALDDLRDVVEKAQRKATQRDKR